MKSILVIDDDRLIRQTFKTHLSGEGFEVHVAPDGLHGVNLFKEIAPSLVILDINLPGLNGLEVLKKIKAMDPKACVIMITAFDDMQTTVEAIKLGADAVSVHINLGAETDKEMLGQLGYVSESCLEWQMPLVAMMYTRGPKIKDEYDVANVKLAARVGAELGADIVKVVYTGSIDSFTEVVHSCPVPVVIAGGAKMDSDEDIFKMVRDALKAGATGVSIGRNAFQHERPEKMVEALCKMVHEAASAEEAVKILQN